MQTTEEKKAYKHKWYLENRDKNKEKQRLQKKIYRKNNKEKIKLLSQLYYAKNKELLKEKRQNNKEEINERKRTYRKNNLDKVKKQEKESQIKKRKDPFYKFKDNIRNRIRTAFRSSGLQKNSKTAEILGCSFVEFREYIESQFEPWMNWVNQGKYNGELNYGWDLDHKTPISYAKTEEDIIKLNHYSNFQPLCSFTNRHIKRNEVLTTVFLQTS